MRPAAGMSGAEDSSRQRAAGKRRHPGLHDLPAMPQPHRAALPAFAIAGATGRRMPRQPGLPLSPVPALRPADALSIPAPAENEPRRRPPAAAGRLGETGGRRGGLCGSVPFLPRLQEPAGALPGLVPKDAGCGMLVAGCWVMADNRWEMADGTISHQTSLPAAEKGKCF